MKVSNSLHHASVPAPFDMQLEAILSAEGDVVSLRPQFFGPLPIRDEVDRYRSLAFVTDLLTKAVKARQPVEVVACRLKELEGFDCEIALLKAVAAVQAAFWAEQTQTWLKLGGAA